MRLNFSVILLKCKRRLKLTRSKQPGRGEPTEHCTYFFEMVAKELNDLGMTYVYRALDGTEYELPWTKELFKEFHWKPLQMAMFGTNSTTKLTSQQIDAIFTSINLFFRREGNRGNVPEPI